MTLVDTSVWIGVFRDKTGAARDALTRALGDEDAVLTRFNQLELLQGCLDEKEWRLLKSYLNRQDYLEMSTTTWEQAARIYFDLRRRGRTVRSPIDCCIAQLALESRVLLLHRDHDFEVIADDRPALRQRFLRWPDEEQAPR